MTIQSHPQPPTKSAKMGSVGRELKLIASSFVKQYYTLLNKAPCFIHNFYNHDSTFIHGTIEMGSDDHTDPVVGREKIEEKMRELQLNDCRAKIKQIDCLETLAGGLVLQVIGELSNDGKPMRRFLQTFVLAPSPDQTRHDGDSQHNQSRAANDNRRGVQISENSPNSSHNQKFYVLNSIFRYQDDGPESEFEDDSVGAKANTSVESAADQVKNEDNTMRVKSASAAHPHVHQQPHQQQHHIQHQAQQQQQQKVVTPAEQPKSSPRPPFVPSESTPSSEQLKRNDVKVVTSNGTSNPVRKSEVSEKVSNENGKVVPSDSQTPAMPAPTNTTVETNVNTPTVASQTSSVGSQQAPAPAAASASGAPVPRQSNEPKTWANMVRNALPPSSPVPQSGRRQPKSKITRTANGKMEHNKNHTNKPRRLDQNKK